MVLQSVLNKSLYSALVFTVVAMGILPICTGEIDYLTEKPSYIKTCKINEPDFTKCSTESIQNLMTKLANGAPELVGDLVLDPMKLETLEFKQDNNEIATIRANLTDLIVRGFKELIIKESRVSKKDFNWDTKILMPTLRLDGNYIMAGRILVLPLSGNGKMFIQLKNVDIKMKTKVRLIEKGGFTFYDIQQIRMFLTIEGLKTNFGGLFNGRTPEIERTTNIFFNENWKELFEALRPLITETVERVIFNILKRVFDKVPANFFVSDVPTPAQLYGT